MANDEEIRRCEDNLAYWNEQSDRVETNSKRLVWLLLVGVVLAVAGALAHPFLGSAIAASTALLWLTGAYTLSKRRLASAAQAQTAQQELDDARRR